MMKIIGCGCSFTYGFYSPVRGSHIKLKDYVTVFSEYLNANCINLARPGATNYAIAKQIEHSISLNPDLVVIGVTTSMRFDFSFIEKKLFKRPDIHDFNYSGFTNSHLIPGNKENIISAHISQIKNRAQSDSRFGEVFDYHIKYTNEFVKRDQDRFTILGALSLLDKKSIPYICIDFYDMLNYNDVKNYINYNCMNLIKKFPLENDKYHFNEEGHIFVANQLLNFKKENDMKRGKL